MEFVQHIFEKYSNVLNFMKIRAVGAELFHADRQTGSQTDRQTWQSQQSSVAISRRRLTAFCPHSALMHAPTLTAFCAHSALVHAPTHSGCFPDEWNYVPTECFPFSKKKHLFFKFPRLYPLDLLCRVALKLGRVTESFIMMVTGGQRSTGRNMSCLHGKRNVCSWGSNAASN